MTMMSEVGFPPATFAEVAGEHGWKLIDIVDFVPAYYITIDEFNKPVLEKILVLNSTIELRADEV
jgi:hypothetical protein